MVNLEALKDYLELVRNFVFGNGLVVIAGIVLQDQESIGTFYALSIVWMLVGAAFVYIAAAIYYVEKKHKPVEANRRQRAIALTRALLLFVFMEASLILVGHHVDRENRAHGQTVVAAGSTPQRSIP